MNLAELRSYCVANLKADKKEIRNTECKNKAYFKGRLDQWGWIISKIDSELDLDIIKEIILYDIEMNPNRCVYDNGQYDVAILCKGVF